MLNHRQPGKQVSSWLAIATLALTFAAAAPARGAAVTVTAVSTTTGSVEDTIIVFDPLDATPPATKGTASIDQANMRFTPHISVLRTGTSVTFPNSDHIRHQVYSFSKPKIFSLKLYAGSPQVAVSFDAPGLVVLGCNIHDRMVAFVGVVDSPYFTKLPASGTATLTLPAGRYRLRVWHPDLAVPAVREVVVADSPLTVPLQLAIDHDAAAVAPWPE